VREQPRRPVFAFYVNRTTSDSDPWSAPLPTLVPSLAGEPGLFSLFLSDLRPQVLIWGLAWKSVAWGG
jgi:hypothetical protein